MLNNFNLQLESIQQIHVQKIFHNNIHPNVIRFTKNGEMFLTGNYITLIPPNIEIRIPLGGTPEQIF